MLKPQWMTAFIALLATAALAAAPDPTLPARLTDGENTQPLLLRDRPLRFRTSCGTIHLPLHDVHAIIRPKLDLRARLETTLGDVWLVEFRHFNGSLVVVDGNESRPLPCDPPQFDRIDINPLAETPPAPGQVRVLLADDQRVRVIPESWNFDIPDGDARWSLPMGTLLYMERASATGADALERWTVMFPSGVKADLPEPPRNRMLAATDRHGNALDLPMRDVIRLEAGTPPPHSIDQPALAIGATSATTGGVAAAEMPFAVIRVTGTLGTVPLPAAMLNAVAPLAAGGGVQATTVYGERFIGSVSPSELTLHNIPGRGEVTVALNQDRVAWEPARKLSLPPGARVWQFADGNLVAASFADDALALGPSGEEPPLLIAATNIVSIMNHGAMLTVSDDRNALHYGRPAAARVALVLLTSGMRCEVPWSQILGVDQDFPATAPAGAPAEADLGPRDGMRRIPGGTFIMGRTRGDGQTDELPSHALTMPDFFMDPSEITRAQFAEFVAATRYRTDAEQAGLATTWRAPGFLQRPDEPAVWVSWRDAAQFCNWRSTAAHLTPCYTFARHETEVTVAPACDGYRLPTEAEWEYAARAGGADVRYPWGDAVTPASLPARANFRAPAGAPADDWLWTNPVRAFPSNDLGLFGMAGNVWEWCEDWYFDRAYASVHRQRPADPCVRAGDVAGLTRRVMRGGSFDSEIELLRCTSRANGLPQASANRVGFRCVRSLAPAAETAR